MRSRGLRTPADQPDLAEMTAAEFVERHGADALRILGERAETAVELGHKVAAGTWRDIADAAARLLGVERAPRPPRGAARLVTRRTHSLGKPDFKD